MTPLPYHPSPKKPDIALPAGACDAHCHVFGPAARFPFAPSRTYTPVDRSEEHTSELQSLMRTSYAVFCLKKNKIARTTVPTTIPPAPTHITALLQTTIQTPT